MYGVIGGVRAFSGESAPIPRPAACSEPSCRARYLWSMATTAGRFRLNMCFHFFSRMCSPWYALVDALAVHFCWKYVRVVTFGALSCDRAYNDHRDQFWRTFCGVSVYHPCTPDSNNSKHTSFFSEWNLGFFLGMVRADQELVILLQ